MQMGRNVHDIQNKVVVYNRYSIQSIKSTNIAKLILCAKGQNHPWVVPLGTSHFDFLRPIGF